MGVNAFQLFGELGIDMHDFDAKTARADQLLGALKRSLDDVENKAKNNQAFKSLGDKIEDFQKKLKPIGDDLLRIGTTMSIGITAPVVAAGVAILKLTSDYNSSMSKIAGLTDSTAAEVAKMKQQVLDMSKGVPQSAKELADGLFFVVSAGFKGDEAMKVLNISARAAAAGLGETKIVADAVTSTLNAYKLGADAAAHVTDILVNAVTQGKMPAEALSSALGRVLPIAAAANVPFEEVAASLATMTRTGLSAEEAATALRGALAELIKPGHAAQEELKAIGMSADELRNSLVNKGLMGTLQTLMEKTGGNIDVLGKIIPNIRALTGVLATAGSQSEQYASILDSMNHASGRADKAFQTVSQNFGFQAKVFLNAIEAIGIELGERLLPRITPVVQWMAQNIPPVLDKLINGFTALPTPVQAVIAAIGGVVVVAGPVMVALGGIITAIATIGATTALVIAGVMVVLTEIVAEVALVATTIYAVWTNNVAGIRDLTLQAWGAVKQFTQEELGAVVNWVKENWPLIKETIETTLNRVKALVKPILDAIQKFWASHGDEIKKIAKDAWDFIKASIDAIGLTIGTAITAAMEIWNGDFRAGWNTITNETTNKALADLDKKIAKALIDMAAHVYVLVQEVGVNIIEGIVVGIAKTMWKVSQAMNDLGFKMAQWVRDKLESHSPSQVFVRIGESISEGLIVGISNMQSGVTAAMEKSIVGPIKKGAEEIKDLLKQFDDRLRDIFTPIVTATDKANELFGSMAAQGVAVAKATKDWILYKASLVDAAEAISKMTRPRVVDDPAGKTRDRLTIIGQMLKADIDAARADFEDLVKMIQGDPTLTRPRVAGITMDKDGATRPRRVFGDSPLLQGIHDTAKQVTDIFRNAVEAGTTGGLKGALHKLISGAGDLLKQFGQKLMDKLIFEPMQESIGKWLEKIAGQGTGILGGLFSKIFGGGGSDDLKSNTAVIRELTSKVTAGSTAMADSIAKTILGTAATSIDSSMTTANTAAIIANTAALTALSGSMALGGGGGGDGIATMITSLFSGFAGGGSVSGQGGPTSDLIPAWLSDGEFVMQASAVQKFGRRFFEALNSGLHVGPRFAYGGGVSAAPVSSGNNNYYMGGGGESLCARCRGAFRESTSQMMNKTAAAANRARFRYS
jgi:TP901 family phage tail tape measure protein